MQVAELLRRRSRDVDNAVLGVWPAIVHFHCNALARLQVGDLDHGAELECTVCGGHGVFIVGLAAGSFIALQAVGIIGSLALHDFSDAG